MILGWFSIFLVWKQGGSERWLGATWRYQRESRIAQDGAKWE
jgi:hypothetical protein